MKKILILILLFTVNSVWSQTTFVTTIHPFQEILKNIIGNRGAIHSIVHPGASPHTYELRPSDLRKIESARALFFGAENLDGWIFKIQTTQYIELLELVPEKMLIYFQDNNRNQKVSSHKIEENKSGRHHHKGIDPHFWTDPLTVKAMLPQLTELLCRIDLDGCEDYRNHSNQFSSHLDSLHERLNQMLSPAQGSSVMISHPFFQYFFKRYGIKLVGVIENSPGKEPTPREIKQLIEQVKNENVKAIFDHSQLPDRAAKLIAKEMGKKVFHLDPLGGVSGRQTYEELLLYNAKIIQEALR